MCEDDEGAWGEAGLDWDEDDTLWFVVIYVFVDFPHSSHTYVHEIHMKVLFVLQPTNDIQPSVSQIEGKLSQYNFSQWSFPKSVRRP